MTTLSVQNKVFDLQFKERDGTGLVVRIHPEISDKLLTVSRFATCAVNRKAGYALGLVDYEFLLPDSGFAKVQGAKGMSTLLVRVTPDTIDDESEKYTFYVSDLEEEEFSYTVTRQELLNTAAIELYHNNDFFPAGEVDFDGVGKVIIVSDGSDSIDYGFFITDGSTFYADIAPITTNVVCAGRPQISDDGQYWRIIDFAHTVGTAIHDKSLPELLEKYPVVSQVLKASSHQLVDLAKTRCITTEYRR